MVSSQISHEMNQTLSQLPSERMCPVGLRLPSYGHFGVSAAHNLARPPASTYIPVDFQGTPRPEDKPVSAPDPPESPGNQPGQRDPS